MAGQVENRVGYQMKRAIHVLRLEMDDALRRLGITTAQYAALNALESGDPLSGAELARRCFVTPQTMTGVLNSLEQRGLIERRPRAAHGRVIETHLTAAGAGVLARAHDDVIALEERMLQGFAPAELTRLRDDLARCADNLGAAGQRTVEQGADLAGGD